jgi:hypothetical protein
VVGLANDGSPFVQFLGSDGEPTLTQR